MDSAKYTKSFPVVYPDGFIKQDKTTLRKFAKKSEYDPKLESLFYVAKEKDGTAFRRLNCYQALSQRREEEKARVFEECHSAPFLDTPAAIGKSKSGFTGLTTTRTRWKWSVKNFTYLPMHPLDRGFKKPALILENIR